MPAIDEILVSVAPGEVRVATLADGRLVDMAIERAADAALGSIYRGRVVRVDAELDAAFVDIGRPRPGFLPAEAARYLARPAAAKGTSIGKLTSEGRESGRGRPRTRERSPRATAHAAHAAECLGREASSPTGRCFAHLSAAQRDQGQAALPTGEVARQVPFIASASPPKRPWHPAKQ
jgi:Ribonuclease G/E